jgi:ppGpp synthetase/RelA/SpoT-type nucleotidyltranferase
MNVNEAVKAYQAQLSTYERFTLKLRALLEELLDLNEIGNYSLEHRTKDVEGFREKISRVGKHYEDPLSEVTDLCGLRIILIRLSDVERVINLIRSEFEIDEQNSVNKEAELKEDQFGYSSVHLVVQLNAARSSLPESRAFKHMKAEIQVRTVLQHAWATISHIFLYKASETVESHIGRRLFRLSAFFEIGDSELEQFAQAVKDVQAAIRTEVQEGDRQVELNADSLRVYIETAPEVAYWLNSLRSGAFNWSIESFMNDLSRLGDVAEFCGIKTLNQLGGVLIEARNWGGTFFNLYTTQVIQEYAPPQIGAHPDDVIVMIVIASFIESFTPQLLKERFGWHDGELVEDSAKKARKLL